MGTSSLHPLDRLKQPEYTGENRCMPCTTVNVVIAIALTAAVAFVNPFVAVPVLVLSLAAIYFRGYLVPGTPTLTQRYFPEWLLAWFDKEPVDADVEAGAAIEEDVVDRDAEPLETVEPEEWLVEHGVIVPCEDVDDLCLPDDLHEAFHDRIDRFGDGDRRQQLGSFLGIDPEELTVDDGSRIIVRRDGNLVARWRSEAPLLVDLAGASVLDERIPAWDVLTVKQRSKVVGGLRAFAERCPLCGDPITFDEQETKSCCGRTRMVYTVGCEACDETLLEFRENVRTGN